MKWVILISVHQILVKPVIKSGWLRDENTGGALHQFVPIYTWLRRVNPAKSMWPKICTTVSTAFPCFPPALLVLLTALPSFSEDVQSGTHIIVIVLVVSVVLIIVALLACYFLRWKPTHCTSPPPPPFLVLSDWLWARLRGRAQGNTSSFSHWGGAQSGSAASRLPLTLSKKRKSCDGGRKQATEESVELFLYHIRTRALNFQDFG